MVATGESAALASRVVGREVSGERAITVDQSNHSVIVAEQFVVKWLTPPVLAPHPGVETMQQLANRGFSDMPKYIGCEIRDEIVVAIVTEYVVGARDGWDWFVDDVDSWLGGRCSFDDLAVSAARMGELTAQLHWALADMLPTTVASRTYHAAAVERLDLALRIVDGPEAERLHKLVDVVQAALAPLDSDALLAAHRVHGDLHAGQFLRSPDRFVIADFDGNPLDGSSARRLSHSPLVDVASLAQSIDHVGRIVLKRRQPDRVDDVNHFIEEAVGAALDAYRNSRPVDDGLLHAFRVAQELHEYCYAAQHLPRWMYIPDTALPALLT